MTKCIDCSGEAVPGRARCEKHLEREGTYRRARRAKRVAARLCVKCGAEAMSGITFCEKCCDKHRERAFKQRAKHKVAGMCTNCGQPAIPGHTCCAKCRDARKERSRKTRDVRLLKQRAARYAEKLAVIALLGGKCVCCGETESSVLVMDHVNNDGHEHRKHLANSRALYKEILAGICQYKVQLLCANCNTSKLVLGECYHKRNS